jgi:hypothetical protein
VDQHRRALKVRKTIGEAKQHTRPVDNRAGFTTVKGL